MSSSSPFNTLSHLSSLKIQRNTEGKVHFCYISSEFSAYGSASPRFLIVIIFDADHLVFPGANHILHIMTIVEQRSGICDKKKRYLSKFVSSSEDMESCRGN